MKLAVLVLVGCTGGSPLVDSGPQVELVADPGNTSGGPLLRLTLTSWVHPTMLGDATEAGQIEATLDDVPLVIDPSSSYAGSHDSYTAAFVMTTERARVDHPTASKITITDHETTWTVAIPDLLTNDLRAIANDALVWPSAATSDPWSTIDWICIDVAARDAACESADVPNPQITIDQQYVHFDVAASRGDQLTITGQRFAHPTATGDGPTVFASIRNRYAATLE